MTSGTGTCSVKYDQAGDANYNAAPQVTETVNAQKADQTINVTTHAPASAAYNSSFDVAATAPGGAVSFSSSGSCSNAGATFTITSGSGTCTVKYDQAGDAQLQRRPAGDRVGQRAEGEPDDHRHAPRARAPPSSAALLGRRQRRRLGQPGDVLQRGRLHEHRRHVHDDERHRHLHGQVRPGRRRELQRRPAGDRVGHGAEGEPDDHLRAAARPDLRRPGLHRQRDGELRPRGLLRRHRPVHGHRHDGPPDRARQLHDHGLAGRRLELRRRDRRLAHLPDQRPRREPSRR